MGGGSPRFWFSLSPQSQQLNYAEVLVELDEKEITPEFVDQVQPVLSANVPGARIDMRQLQTNPVNYPVEIRVTSRADVGTAGSAQDIRTMRQIAAQVADTLRSAPAAARVRNEWDAESAHGEPECRSRPRQPGGHYQHGRRELRHQRDERRSCDRTAGWRQKHSSGGAAEDG